MNQPAHKDSAASATGRHQRRARNYLIDPRFQLKYTGLLVAVALALSIGLGAQLARTGKDLIVQSQQTVEQGRQTVQRGKQMLAESKKVSAVVAMNIAKDPDYAENPELAAVFKENAAERDRQLDTEQKNLENDSNRLAQQATYLLDQQKNTFYLLLGGLSVLVVAIGLAGIVFTHKIAGPVFKMTGLLRRVSDGHYELQPGLRKGDELQHFYDTFRHMIEALRDREAKQIERLQACIESLEGDVPKEKLTALREMKREMQSRLE